MSLANAANNYNLSSSLLLQIYKTLTILSTLDYKIYIQWMKAHTNIHGNEIADSLAKKGALSGINTFSKIPISYFHQFFNDEGLNHFALLYHNSPHRKRLLKFFPNILDIFNSKLPFDSSISSLILTGHGSVNKHLFSMGLSPSANWSSWADAP